MATILDYSDYVAAPEVEGSMGCGNSCKPLPNLGLCPHCEGQCPKRVYNSAMVNPRTGPEWSGDLFRCVSCGWWDLLLFQGIMDDPYLYTATRSESHYRAVLRRLDSFADDTPIAVLCDYARRHPSILRDTKAKSLEKVVQSVLADLHIGGEVRHVGRHGGRGDKGIDLLLILGDKTYAVQVKGHTRPGMTEPVEQVRAFLAATQLAGHKEAVMISTADRFTKGAVEVAADATAMGLVNSFELHDFSSFVAMLRLARGQIPLPLRHFDIASW